MIGNHDPYRIPPDYRVDCGPLYMNIENATIVCEGTRSRDKCHIEYNATVIDFHWGFGDDPPDLDIRDAT
eukprot:UN03162